MARSRNHIKPADEYIPAPPPPADGSCTEWCAPLHLIESKCSDHPLLKWFSVDDLMIMGAVLRVGHPTLYLYKHRDTRRDANIDADGVAWRYVPPAPDDFDDGGTYERLTSLADALDGLALWELPVMRDAPFEEVWEAYAAAPNNRHLADDEDDEDDDDIDDYWDDDYWDAGGASKKSWR